jgi:hypothetical protein
MLEFDYPFHDVIRQHFAVHEQESRLRFIFELERGPLPKINAQWLRKYHAHLSSKLLFPFHARYTEDSSGAAEPIVYPVEVFGLVSPEEIQDIEETGLLCRVLKDISEDEVPLVDLELAEDHPNFQLLEDYWYWIWNWRFDPGI